MIRPEPSFKRQDQLLDDDCARAVLASMLEIPIQMVPNFIEMEGLEHFYEGIDRWLREQNLIRVTFAVVADSPEKAARMAFCPFGGLRMIMIGTSPRGINHAVIVRDGVLDHDPNPKGEGLTGPTVEGYYSIWVLSPVRFVVQDGGI